VGKPTVSKVVPSANAAQVWMLSSVAVAFVSNSDSVAVTAAACCLMSPVGQDDGFIMLELVVCQWGDCILLV